MLPPGSPVPPVGDSGPARREAAGAVRGRPPASKSRNRESTEPSGRRQCRRLPGLGFRLRRGREAGGSLSRRTRRRWRRCSLSPRTGAGRVPPGPRRRVGIGPRWTKRRTKRPAARLSALVRPPIRVDDQWGPEGAGSGDDGRRSGFRGRNLPRDCSGRAAVSFPVAAIVIPVADRPEGRRPGGAGADCPGASGRDSCSLHAPSGTPTFLWWRMSIRFARPAVSRTSIRVRRPRVARNS